MKRVVIESPLSGDFERNVRYAKLCMLDCLRRGEAPYASHLLMTQVLDDEEHTARRLGMRVGFAWARGAELAAVYEDLGVSGGMCAGVEEHERNGTPVERRRLPPELLARLDEPGVPWAPTRGF